MRERDAISVYDSGRASMLRWSECDTLCDTLDFLGASMNVAYGVSTLTSQLDPEAGQQPVGSIFFQNELRIHQAVMLAEDFWQYTLLTPRLSSSIVNISSQMQW